MKMCKDCKHWGDEDIVDRYGVDDDGDEILVDIPEVRRCFSPRVIYKFRDGGATESYPSEGGALIWDGECHYAGFGTTGTFGCSCWEWMEKKP